MAVTTYEGVVEKGKIRLKEGVHLPENAKVYVVVPDVKMEKKKMIQILTPSLAHREDAHRFKLTVTEENQMPEYDAKDFDSLWYALCAARYVRRRIFDIGTTNIVRKIMPEYDIKRVLLLTKLDIL